jgi:hypothetical protein
MIYIGIDNGTSSNGIGVVSNSGDSWLYKTPIKKEPSYTKVAKNISRIDYPKLLEIFTEIKLNADNKGVGMLAGMERPMVNPGRFFASMSAMRAVEATLIALEALEIPYVYLDSKEWQHVLLPKGTEKDDLKKASLAIGKRLFPKLPIKVDADGLLIAEYLRIKNTREL